MNIAMLINFVCIVLIVVMGLQIFKLSKRNKKNKKLIKVVDHMHEEDEFFSACSELIETINDREFEAKGRVLQLWGAVLYNKEELFHSTLQELNLEDLILHDAKNPKKNGIDFNEDSFFYLYLACPNRLFYMNRMDLIDELWDKMDTVDEDLKNYLVCEIGKQNRMFYKADMSTCTDFYQKVLDGNYSEYKYSKQLIGLYKDVITCMLARVYQDQENKEKYDELSADLKEFNKSRLGDRFIKELNLSVPEDKKEDTAPEVMTEEQKLIEKEADETAADDEPIEAEIIEKAVDDTFGDKEEKDSGAEKK